MYQQYYWLYPDPSQYYGREQMEFLHYDFNFRGGGSGGPGPHHSPRGRRGRGRMWRIDIPQVSTGGESSLHEYRRGGGHPPHLRGRAIGLYYRNKKRKELKVKFIPKLVLSRKRMEHIETLLDKLNDEKSSPDQNDEIKPLRTHFQREYNDITTVSFMEKLEHSLTYRDNTTDRELMEQRNNELRSEMLNKIKKTSYQNMLEFRKSLPTYQHRTEILRAVENNQVVVISGDTGCGKSTQVGQLILEEDCNSGRGAEVRILITQPRRLAATSVAARIADERGEVLGNSVGYAIRLETVPPRDYGSIEVVTAGVVLQRLQRDPALVNVSHLLIDEAHERDTTCDILLGIVKQILLKRKDLKVILMSATMDSERFCSYFNGCPKVLIPGRMFPVEVYHLEDVLEMTGFTGFKMQNVINYHSRKKRDKILVEREEDHKRKLMPYVMHLRSTGNYRDEVLDTLLRSESEELSIDLATELVIKLCRTEGPGAILVFLPGFANISVMCKQLEQLASKMPPHVVYPLHSQLSSLDQNAIFKEPPSGVRKIIVSTNIAETSITINDVVYVIDCGKIKVGNYDVVHDIKTLHPEWVSQANALQRQGRAGRVCPGKCYRLYTGHVYNELRSRLPPELLRAPVHEPLLASLLLRLHPAPQFLASLLDPPQETAVKTAINLLTRMNILNETEHLTPLGVHVARLPVSPGAARMLIYASLLSAVTPITRVAAVVAFKDPFSLVIGKERQIEECRLSFSNGTCSDQLAAAEAQRQWENIYKNGDRRQSSGFCWENFLSERTLQLLLDMRQQFGQLLHDTHFTTDSDPDHPESNRHSDNEALLKALIVAGLYPNVAFFKSRRQTRHSLATLEDGRVEIHPGSVNARSLPAASHVVYRLKQLTTRLYIHDTSPAYALPLLFFGDKFRVTDDEGRPGKCIVWCGSLCWRTTRRKATLVERLREELHTLLQDRLEDPRPVRWNSKEGTILSAIIELIGAEDNPDEMLGETDDGEDVEEPAPQPGKKKRAKMLRKLMRSVPPDDPMDLETDESDDDSEPINFVLDSAVAPNS